MERNINGTLNRLNIGHEKKNEKESNKCKSLIVSITKVNLKIQFILT